MLKKFVFKKISTIEIPKSSKLHRYVSKVRKLYHARYKCNNKRDPKIINLNKMPIPKKLICCQQRKIKGAICNVPVECDKTCQTLPPESSGIILLKLKCKLQFRGHVYYQAVRPEIVLNALNWLKANNELYKTITIDIDRIDRNLTTLEVTSIPECTTSTSTDVEQPMNEQDISTDEIITEQINDPKNEQPVINETSKKAQQEEQEEEIDDPLNKHRAPNNETCIQAIIPDYPVTIDQQNVSTGQEIYSIAPGENKHPVSFMKDKKCEELAFPVLFPKGRYGYTTERKIHLTPTKYFNARLLHHSGRFANNTVGPNHPLNGSSEARVVSWEK